MSRAQVVLLPRQIDPSGPKLITDFARCTGMDEYDSYVAIIGDIGRYDAAIAEGARLDADAIDRGRSVGGHRQARSGPRQSGRQGGVAVRNTSGADSRSVAEHIVGCSAEPQER